MTDTNRFRTIAKDEICRLERDIYGREITHEDIQVVFMAYVLGQMKSTMVVAKNTEGRYYEVSYSCINDKMFIDVYEKKEAVVVDIKNKY
jgi:hypothetical protein